MLLYKELFENYQEFQELFGMVEHGNGEKSRRNKILLSMFKSKDMLEYSKTHNFKLMRLTTMSLLRTRVINELNDSLWRDHDHYYSLKMGNVASFLSTIYETDESEGLCEDGDIRQIRYVNHENNRVWKMKVSRLLNKICDQSEFGRALPEQVRIWLGETLTNEWRAYAQSMLPQNTLVVGDELQDFEDIYNSYKCKGDFYSCMVNKDFHYFYKNAVNSSAAYLKNEDGEIIARCIIFNACYDDEGNVWRLAERQYSTRCDDVLKLALVNQLIQAGRIDGYKKVGADCHNSRAFVDINGEDLSHKVFHIECNLDFDDELSYQDSFKYYDMDSHVAWNSDCKSYDYDLATTEGSLEGGNWDEYHEYYTRNDTRLCYYHGNEVYVDEENMDDFYWVESEQEYHHENDVTYCEYCGEYSLNDDAYHSEITDCYYCCEDCQHEDEERYCSRHNILYSTLTYEKYDSEEEMEEAELDYKRDNWYYSELLDEYFEFENQKKSAELNTFITDYEGNIIRKDESILYIKTYRTEPNTFLETLYGSFYVNHEPLVVHIKKGEDEIKYRIYKNYLVDVNPDTNEPYECAINYITSKQFKLWNS